MERRKVRQYLNNLNEEGLKQLAEYLICHDLPQIFVNKQIEEWHTHIHG